MWGWKTAERIVEHGIGFEQAKEIIIQNGFQLHRSNPTHAVFRRKLCNSGGRKSRQKVKPSPSSWFWPRPVKDCSSSFVTIHSLSSTPETSGGWQMPWRSDCRTNQPRRRNDDSMPSRERQAG